MPKKEKFSPEEQKAFAKAYDEFQVRMLGKDNMNIGEMDELRDYVMKRTDLQKDEKDLTVDERAWKRIYEILDKSFEEGFGKETKDKLDELKGKRDASMRQIEASEMSVEKLIQQGRKIEELLVKQWAYISFNFNKEENNYRQKEEALSEIMVREDGVTKKEKIEAAEAILALSKKYREILIKPTKDLLDEIHSRIAKFEKDYRDATFEPISEEPIKVLKDTFAEWLELTKDLYQGRVKAVTAMISQLDADEFMPNLIIKHEGDSSFKVPADEFAKLVATYGTLAKMGSEKENEISPKRDPISVQLFGKHEEYMKTDAPSTSNESPVRAAPTNPLEGKAWFRLAKVIYIGAYIFIGLIVLVLLASGSEASDVAFWVAVIGIGIMTVVKKAFYYVTLGKTSWK